MPTASTTAAAVPRWTAPAIPATCTTAVTVWRLKTRKKARRSTESASRSPRSGGSASVFDDAVGPVSIEALTPLEELELDQEREPNHLCLELAHQVDRSEHRAAGGEQVVHDEDSLPRKDRVLVHFERVRAVLERVLHADRLGGQLAELADGDETRIELVRHGCAEDEPARLHAHDQIDPLITPGVRQKVDRLVER